MPAHTLLDIQKLSQGTELVPLVESVLTYSPEVSTFPAKTVPKGEYYTVERTALPTTGFRAANEGIAPSKSSFSTRLHETFIVGGAVQFDRSVAKKFSGGMAELEMIETRAVLKSAMLTLGKQIWYGTSNDGKGFPGLKAFTPTTADIVLDAGGSSAGTASSIYMVKFGDDGVQLVLGNDSAFNLEPFYDQSLFDSSGNQYPGRVANLDAWVGLATAGINSVGRIYNVTADSSKTASDTLLGQLLAKFPVGYIPDAIFMSRRSRQQLQASRTHTVNTNGGTKITSGSSLGYAPIPTDFEGIPIYATDSILNTDTIGT